MILLQQLAGAIILLVLSALAAFLAWAAYIIWNLDE